MQAGVRDRFGRLSPPALASVSPPPRFSPSIPCLNELKQTVLLRRNGQLCLFRACSGEESKSGWLPTTLLCAKTEAWEQHGTHVGGQGTLLCQQDCSQASQGSSVPVYQHDGPPTPPTTLSGFVPRLASHPAHLGRISAQEEGEVYPRDKGLFCACPASTTDSLVPAVCPDAGPGCRGERRGKRVEWKSKCKDVRNVTTRHGFRWLGQGVLAAIDTLSS